MSKFEINHPTLDKDNKNIGKRYRYLYFNKTIINFRNLLSYIYKNIKFYLYSKQL